MFWTTSLRLLWLIGLLWIALLILSAEKTVQRSLDLAYHYWLSEVFIWLTILSIGTSIPEISSNIIGWFGILTWWLDAHIGSATVLGANVWSSIVQQTLIIWSVTILLWHLKFNRIFLAENYIALIATFLIVFILAYDEIISRSDSFIMLLVFVLYLYFLYRQEWRHRHNRYEQIDKWALENPKQTWIMLIIWFIGVFIGSAVALETVQGIVTLTGVSGSLLWVMTLGIASSLPEFITSLSAMKKQAQGISIGTLIWSNIVNPLMGIGAWWIVAWYIVPHSYITRDMPVQIVTACILLLRVNRHHRVMPKLAWVILIMTYVIYILVRMQWFSVDF